MVRTFIASLGVFALTAVPAFAEPNSRQVEGDAKALSRAADDLADKAAQHFQNQRALQQHVRTVEKLAERVAETADVGGDMQKVRADVHELHRQAWHIGKGVEALPATPGKHQVAVAADKVYDLINRLTRRLE